MKYLDVVVVSDELRLSGSTMTLVVTPQTDKREGQGASKKQAHAPGHEDPFFKVNSPRAVEGSLLTVTSIS